MLSLNTVSLSAILPHYILTSNSSENFPLMFQDLIQLSPPFIKLFLDFYRQGYFSTLSVLHILYKAKVFSHLTVRTFIYVSDPWTVHPQEQLCLFYLCSLCHLLPPFPLPSTFPYFLLGPGPQQVANKH